MRHNGWRPASAVLLGGALLLSSGAPVWSAVTGSTKQSKSVAAPVFVGPPGWLYKGASNGLGVWTRQGDTNYSENIIVEAKDGFSSLDALLTAEVAYVRSLPDVVGSAPTDTSVCGDHPAKYLSYTYSSSSGLPITSEVVIAVFGTTAYSARYNKAIGQDPDAAAERSLTSLCGRAAAHQAPRHTT